MKAKNKLGKLLLGGMIFGVVMVAGPAPAADVGVSVTVGQPGFYGRLDIGDFPRPVLIYPQPIIVHRPVGVVYEPVYLHVPPGQAKKWHAYCGHYNACNRPVYFVQDRWYNEVYVPEYRTRHGGGHSHYDGRHDKRDHDKGYGKRDHDKGHGKKEHDKDHGKWHEKGKGKHD